jgi:patatin-like phospholipase/acyl hydrolase
MQMKKQKKQPRVLQTDIEKVTESHQIPKDRATFFLIDSTFAGHSSHYFLFLTKNLCLQL